MIRPLDRIFYSFNLGFAIALSVTMLGMRMPVAFVHGKAESPDLFHSLVSKLNGVFGRVPWSSLGALLVLTCLTVALSALLLLLSNLPRRGVSSRTSLVFLLAGVSAIGAVPLSWFFAITRGWPATNWLAVLLEFAIVAAVMYLSRAWAKPVWLTTLSVHYATWGWFIYTVTDELHWGFEDWTWPMILSAAAPFAGFIWTVRAVQARQAPFIGEFNR